MVRTVSVSGNMEPDDLENAASVADANRGTVARQGEFLYLAGSHLEAVDEVAGHRLPGEVYICSTNTETMARGFWDEWDRRMGPVGTQTGGRA